MAYSVEMPELGESVTEGTVTQWLKKVGDKVSVDEPLLEVSTDKVDTEIPSPASGVLLKIIAEEDDTVDVGAVIAEIGEEGEEPSGSDADSSSDDDSSDAAEESGSAESESGSDDSESESSDNSGSGSGSGSGSASGEAEDVTMPELGESVTEGTITQWLKSVGDKVEVDEPLLEVSTDKVDTEIPSPVAGTLVEILANEDDTVDVGAVIARIGDGNAAKSGSSDSSSDSSESDESADSSDSSESESDSSESDSSDDSESKSSDNSGSGSASGEAEDVTMPELGESVTEGTITQWLKSVGDKVEVDEPLLEVSTDKVDTEIPSPIAGTLVEILANEDDTVDVGAVIARIGDENAAKSGSSDSSDSGSSKSDESASEDKTEKSEKSEDKAEPKAEEKKAEAKQAEEKAEVKTEAKSESKSVSVSRTSWPQQKAPPLPAPPRSPLPRLARAHPPTRWTRPSRSCAAPSRRSTASARSLRRPPWIPCTLQLS